VVILKGDQNQDIEKGGRTGGVCVKKRKGSRNEAKGGKKWRDGMQQE
jgi:hypothetical protein